MISTTDRAETIWPTPVRFDCSMIVFLILLAETLSINADYSQRFGTDVD